VNENDNRSMLYIVEGRGVAVAVGVVNWASNAGMGVWCMGELNAKGEHMHMRM
jgi:hypothetical protein